MPMQNALPVTINMSKLKPEIEFESGGRPFSQTGSSNNSAVD